MGDGRGPNEADAGTGMGSIMEASAGDIDLVKAEPDAEGSTGTDESTPEAENEASHQDVAQVQKRKGGRKPVSVASHYYLPRHSLGASLLLLLSLAGFLVAYRLRFSKVIASPGCSDKGFAAARVLSEAPGVP